MKGVPESGIISEGIDQDHPSSCPAQVSNEPEKNGYYQPFIICADKALLERFKIDSPECNPQEQDADGQKCNYLGGLYYCLPQTQISLFVFVSGKIIRGRNSLASSKSINANDIIRRMSSI